MLYVAYNAIAPATLADVFVGVTTGTAAKTMLQIATPSTCPLRVRAWGVSFNGSAAATPIKVSLIDSGSAATTGTAHVAAGLMPYDSEAGSVVSLMTLGTAATGYSFTTDTAPTTARVADAQYVAPSAGYSYEWALGKEFAVPASRFLRLRVHANAAVDCVCWIRYEE